MEGGGKMRKVELKIEELEKAPRVIVRQA